MTSCFVIAAAAYLHLARLGDEIKVGGEVLESDWYTIGLSRGVRIPLDDFGLLGLAIGRCRLFDCSDLPYPRCSIVYLTHIALITWT